VPSVVETMPTMESEPCGESVCRVKVLPYMFLRLSRITAEGESLEQVLDVVMEILQARMGMARGMVGLYHANIGKLILHKSSGLSEAEKARGIYSPGEGIVGKVVETGKPIVLPRIAEAPGFLDRTGSHCTPADQNHSFLCVPIARGRKLLGVIAAERFYEKRKRLELDTELLSTIACMIAPAVELHLMETEEKASLEQENQRLQDALRERFQPTSIIGSSRPMREVYRMIAKVAPSRATVLILGESGVGKELVSSAIHYASPVSTGPFVQFNCAALPESLVESELFGHEKGSFTGAIECRKGRFEEADGGTIFLDEVGELSLSMQAKILRVLQEKTFERVGGNVSVKVEVRVLAATNRDLTAMVKAGTFRGDLYYRLWVVPIVIPPLRDRGSDIIALADHFIAKYAREGAKDVKRISTSALDMLMSYHWPGNVRELENVIERAVILSDDDVIHSYNLPPSLQSANLSGTICKGTLKSKLEAVEREMIVEALRSSQGSVTKAAQSLGLTRRLLGIRMRAFKLDFHGFRHIASTLAQAT